ncbi:MAG: sulfatase-like hydrolase/transferase, partial [Endomicrobium sp.]|nr:sulfatase-like hydrolase/transferase [Endomicrobium sp.]
MKDFKTFFFKIVSLNFIFLLLMSAYRFIFFVHYGKSIDLNGLCCDILRAFCIGVRFDLSVISGINAPAMLLFIILFIVGRQDFFKPFIKFLKYYYTILIGILFVLFCIDFHFYAYFQDHLNILIYGFFEDDTKALIKTFYENYNLFLTGLIILVFFAVVFFISKFILKFKNYNFLLPNKIARILISAILSFFIFMFIRGSVSWHAIGVYSDISSNTFVNKVAINCVFTLQRAIEHKAEERKDIDYIVKTGYGNDIRRAFADFLNKDISTIPQKHPEKSIISKTSFNKKIENAKPTVILIVMESFGGDLIKYNSKNFNILGSLKKHFDKDIVFYNFSSEGNITVNAVEATFLNTAIRPNAFYISQSKYVYKKYLFASLYPYKKNGYETFFIYGDNSSWRNIGTFALNSGFDKALSGGVIKKNFQRGPWGIYDKYLFDLVFETLSHTDSNKFIYVLTTTNHPPYSLPGDYKKLPLEIPDSLKNQTSNINNLKKRFAVYQYANEMLGQFIDKIKSSKYADNTIIAVTGDHSYNAYHIESFFDNICVPFYLYIPKTIKPKNIDTHVLGSHLDIMPTLYNLSLSNIEYMSEGTDLLSKKALNNTILYKDYIMNRNFIVHKD